MNQSMSPFGRLYSELRRRRVLRTGALYIVGAWLVMQVADVVFPGLGIPEESIRFLLFAALLGFPAALVFGWFFDIDNGGIHRTAAAGADEVGVPQPLRRSDYLILAALVAVIGAIGFGAVGNVLDAPRTVNTDARDDGLPMVAVLPFTFSSRGGDGEFFANGVHDDLLTQLAQLSAIRVISRKSMLAYRDSPKRIPEIGRELGADVVLEGGVQVAGEQIRINAQLINARSDAQLWGQTFDRKLTTSNIFEVQSEISRAIAAALQANLSDQEEAQLAVIPTENMAAYRAFHQSNQLSISDPEHLALLEQAVTLDPTFTRALAELAGRLAWQHFYYDRPGNIPRAESLIEQIRTVAPNSADLLAAESLYTYYILRDNATALRLITQALDQAPSNIRLIEIKGQILRRQGDFDGKHQTTRLIASLDPKDPLRTRRVIQELMLLHRYDEAQRRLDEFDDDSVETLLLKNALRLRAEGDLNRYVSRIKALYREFREPGGKSSDMGFLDEHLADTLIAVRDYEAAEKLAASRPMSRNPNLPEDTLLPRQRIELTLYALMGDQDRLAPALAAARATIEPYYAAFEQGEAVSYLHMWDVAVVAAAERDAEKTQRAVSRLEYLTRDDGTLTAYNRESLCRFLGLSGATAAAVACLRTGLGEPSFVHPYLDPLLPYYDPIRSEPEFVALVDELQQAGELRVLQ